MAPGLSVAVVGFEAESRSAARHWQALGAEVTIRDQRDGAGYLDDLEQFDLVVRSPMVDPNLLLHLKRVTTPTQEFFARCPAPIVGVTGSHLVIATAGLVAEILKAAGLPVLTSASGTSALDLLPLATPKHVVVLELSAGQLVDLHRSPTVAVCLGLTADQAEATARIFRYQAEEDLAVFLVGDPIAAEMAALSRGGHFPAPDHAAAASAAAQHLLRDVRAPIPA